MTEPFVGIERRLEKLADCLNKLDPLTEQPETDFRDDPYLRDIVERNLEVSAQCVIDVANRIISLEGAPHPQDYRTAIIRLGELGVIEPEFAEKLAPLAGFRNILVHQYLDIDWSIVYTNLRGLDDLRRFDEAIRSWLVHDRSDFD